MADENNQATKLQNIGSAEILELLPHRAPFLMVDALEEMDGEARCVGIKKVREDEYWIPGHFPGWPVMPGVLIVECMAQTAAALVSHNRKDEIDVGVVYFMAVDKCRFRQPVTPGDTLRLEVEQIRRKGPVWKYKGTARVGDKLVAEAEFTAMNYLPEA